jgi:hypothetical protein
MESEKAKVFSRNPNRRSEVAKAGVGKWYLPGTYLAATTVIGVVLTRAERTDRASRALAGPPPLADAKDRRKGIAVKLLDGCVLSLVWNGLASEGTPDGATTFLPGPPWGGATSGSCRCKSRQRGGNTREGKGCRRPWTEWHSTPPLPTDR